MRLNRTDIFATFAVGVGVLAYLLWLVDTPAPGMGSSRVVGAVVLGLGWLASAVAVVPHFDELIRSSRAYLFATSVLGVTALTAGVLVLLSPGGAMLTVLVSATIAMWVLATIRHTLAARRRAGSTATAAVQTVHERELVGSSR